MARSHGGPWSDFFKSGSSLGSGGFESPYREPVAKVSSSKPPELAAHERDRLKEMSEKKIAEMERDFASEMMRAGAGTFTMRGRSAGKSTWMAEAIKSTEKELVGTKEPVDERGFAAGLLVGGSSKTGSDLVTALKMKAADLFVDSRGPEAREIEELVHSWTPTHTAALRIAQERRVGFWRGWAYATASGITWGPGGMAMGGMLKPDHAPTRPDHLIAVDESAAFSKKTLEKMFTGRSDLGISHTTIRPPIQMADGHNLYWDASKNGYVNPFTGMFVAASAVEATSAAVAAAGKAAEEAAAKPPAAPEADLDELVARAAGDFGVF